MPDLAESLGKPSDGGKTWTYTLRKGVKFEDGTPVTSKDVKYARRALAGQDDVPQRPDVLQRLPRPAGLHQALRGPDAGQAGLRRSRRPTTRRSSSTSSKPFGGFDYFAQLPSTVPVPAAKDTGSKYKEHVGLHGPVHVRHATTLGKSFTLKRNPNWDPATDPNRKALPDQIEVTLNVNADDIDNRLLSGDLDVDIDGTGVQPRRAGPDPRRPDAQGPDATTRSTRGSGTPRSTPTWRRWTTSTAARRCMYAVDRTGYQRAYGGAAGGDIATNLLPPVIPGCADSSTPTPAPSNNGDLAKAKDELHAVRPAQRLHHQHLLPRRAARRRRRPPRRCSSRWRGSASS